MSIEFNEITAFFTSGLGILVQIVLFIGGLIPLLKYLDQRFDSQIDERVKKKLDPHIAEFCKDLAGISTKLQQVEISTTTAIEYINRAISHLQRDYRLDDNNNNDPNRESTRL